ncbi:MFS general substrate transporter [Achaetomium macrosporum]|uniref:MFS general substrate transporter n=1 Tax=Achaetomium macrosporum TaxID=79813 RepID=A0AAN7C5D2_9PEZI|nr:MFS general substrate transporter [Achaetomium macrosporum]
MRDSSVAPENATAEWEDAASTTDSAEKRGAQDTGHETPAPLGTTSTDEKNEEHEPDHPIGLKLIMIGFGLCLAVLCSNLDRSILGVATPQITADFNSLGDIGWYGSAYLLMSCCSQMFFGKVYAHFNVKWIFLSALAIFEIGSVLCAAAASSDCLIVGRAVAGLGATGISTGALLIISRSMPISQRPKYTAMIGAAMGVTLVIAPFLGGILTDKVTWRWCFWINLPLGGLALLITFFLVHLPEKPEQNDAISWAQFARKVDLVGNIILLPGVVCLLLAFQWGGTIYAWNSWRCILLLCIFGIVSLIWAVIQVRGGDNSTVPMRLLKIRSILAATWFAFCLFGMLFVQSYYIPVWFQAAGGDSAYTAGIKLLATTAAMTVFFPITGFMTTATGYYVPSMIAGSVVSAVASGLMLRFGLDTSTVYWAIALVLSGMGFGLGGQQCMMVPQTILQGEDIALGTSVIMFAETLSGSVFLAVSENVFETRLIRELTFRAPAANPAAVIANGASGLRPAMSKLYDTQTVDGILDSFVEALQPVWIIGVVLAALSLVGALATEWASVKRKDKDRQGKTAVSEDTPQSDATP